MLDVADLFGLFALVFYALHMIRLARPHNGQFLEIQPSCNVLYNICQCLALHSQDPDLQVTVRDHELLES